MADKAKVKDLIRSTFARAVYPGDWCLRGSNEGDEPFDVERDFKGKTNWQTLDAEFIDRSPDGLASALSFFSDEAFHFYIPAYMIADIDGRLKSSNPLFHLTYGLDNSSQRELINPRRYGVRTFGDCARHKFSMFTKVEVSAIVAYLELKVVLEPWKKESVEEALNNYWYVRSKELGM